MQKTKSPPVKGIRVRQPEPNQSVIDPRLIAATTIIGDKVIGSDNKELGKIEEIIMDLTAGTISYVVLSSGGLLGIGDKFFAIPLDHLTFDTEEKVLYLDIDRAALKKHPGFDKEDWPSQAEWPLK